MAETEAETEFSPKAAVRKLVRTLRPHPPKPPARTTSKAGRNLPAAVGTAVVLLTVFALSLVVRIEIFVALAVVFLGIGLWEYAGAVMAREIRIAFLPLLAGQTLMLLCTWAYGLTHALTVLLIWCALYPALRKTDSRENLSRSVAGTFALAWIGFSGCFAVAMAAEGSAGPKLIAALILLPVANDTGGWLLGVLFGRHPIAASISPKKSWEGFFGSFLLALAASALTVGLLIGLSWKWVLIFGAATPVLATAGDFAESMLKRDLGIKDMGSIFPGHGGMLDRLDSILFCGPTFYFLFLFALNFS
ncbi:phosphatidate cytidylyltransferase [Arcanobacterium sp. S3PF19]|uniref:phosphatidate cytidylyltransferase n=1 Tax=Arcanobacterium sp. S3PF19 TaxID=1219585 RepID=UPI00068E62A6|nr:phosphatidate cytidylyltransferase [Arcanobacterium sp. S3PF19]